MHVNSFYVIHRGSEKSNSEQEVAQGTANMKRLLVPEIKTISASSESLNKTYLEYVKLFLIENHIELA